MIQIESKLVLFGWSYLQMQSYRGLPRGSIVKNLPTMQGIQVWSLDQEDPLEEDMATHSSILSWRIPWTEEPGRLQSIESRRIGHNEANKKLVDF